MVELRETLLRDPKCRLWFPEYTITEAKMVKEDGFRGLTLAVRKDTGHTLNKFKNNREFVVEAIDGLTGTGNCLPSLQ